MKVVKQTADYTIYQKGSGRYAVKGADRKWINGDAKAKILVDEKLVTLTAPRPAAVEEPAAGEGAAAASESGEEQAES